MLLHPIPRLVDASSAEIASLFRQSDDDEKKTAVDEFSLPVIVLIVVAGILLLMLVVAMVAIAKNHKRYCLNLAVLSFLKKKK